MFVRQPEISIEKEVDETHPLHPQFACRRAMTLGATSY
jgi:hypothetical protein